MSRDIFVSYKYADDDVKPLCGHIQTKSRHYVDELQRLLTSEDHIYYGEHDGEDLSHLTDEQIWERLKDKIFPTSCTIVLISPQMKNLNSYDKSQWIPWEIYYSLRETTRSDRKSHRNAILAVVLPNKNGQYDYALSNKICCLSGCTLYKTDKMFTILRKNMFNKLSSRKETCPNKSIIWYGECSYIPMIRWDYFKDHITEQIERAESIKEDYERNESYKLHLSVNE